MKKNIVILIGLICVCSLFLPVPMRLFPDAGFEDIPFGYALFLLAVFIYGMPPILFFVLVLGAIIAWIILIIKVGKNNERIK
jgi:hypothetical protein